MMNLFPSPGAPYYIVSPPYTEKSAGVKVLHMLCHALNMSGQRAYMVPMAVPRQGGETYCADFVAPPITAEARAFYSAAGKEPIVIYPDIISDNPLGAKRVVRYLLAYPGHNGGDKTFRSTDQVWGFSTRIARAAGTSKVLFLPFWDTRIFHPPAAPKPRKGGCFYAWKWQRLYGRPLHPITAGMREINRDLSLQEMANILCESEVFCSYDETAVIHSAALCGCPVVLLPSDKFKDCHTLEDLGTDGIAIVPEELEHAKATVAKAWPNYQAALSRFAQQLATFIEETQNGFSRTAPSGETQAFADAL